MLKIQQYISLFDSIKEANKHLAERLNLKIYEDTLRVGENSMEDVYVYNPHPTKSPPNDPIVREACGLILNEDGDIVSMSFEKMANINRFNYHTINWKLAKAELKADGALVVVYNYKSHWNIQTKYRANADNGMLSSDISYRTAVLTVLGEYYPEQGPYSPFDCCQNPELCYAFEFVSPYNKNVRCYNDSNLILLGVFNKTTLKEKSEYWINNFHLHCCGGYRFIRPQTYNIGSPKAAIELSGLLDATEAGFIIKDENMNRLKSPNPNYSAISKVVLNDGQASAKTFARLIINGTIVETRHIYPECAPVLDLFLRTIANVSDNVTTLWNKYKDIENKRAFARAIKHHNPVFKTYLFMLRRKQIKTVEDGLKKMRSEVLVDITRRNFPDEFYKHFGTEGI